MDIQRLVFLTLDEVIKQERQQGEIAVILKNKGFNLTDTQIREIAKFIEDNHLGSQLPLSLGRNIITANSNAVTFVNKQKHIPFEQRLKLIYAELMNLPGMKGDLENILDSLGIEYNIHDISNYVKHCNNTGQARCFNTKTGCEITLTQLGIDYLYQDQTITNEPVVQNISIEQYTHSIVNKGDNNVQLGSFESGIKKDSNNATTIPTTTPNPNSPTRTIQRWQLIVAIIVLGLGALTFYFNYCASKGH